MLWTYCSYHNYDMIRLKGRLLALGYDRVDVKNFILNEAMRVIIENRVVKINNRGMLLCRYAYQNITD